MDNKINLINELISIRILEKIQMKFLQKINIRIDSTPTPAPGSAGGGARVWWFGLRFTLSITPPFYKLGVPLGAQPKCCRLELVYTNKLS